MAERLRWSLAHQRAGGDMLLPLLLLLLLCISQRHDETARVVRQHHIGRIGGNSGLGWQRTVRERSPRVEETLFLLLHCVGLILVTTVAAVIFADILVVAVIVCAAAGGGRD